MTPQLPRLAAWLLRVTVPDRWADSVAGDVEADWHARLARGGGLGATFRTTADAALIAARFVIEGIANAIEGTRRDTREAMRALGRRPRFTVATLLTLALGIGINVAAFTIVDRVVLAPLPYGDPDALVELRARDSEGREAARTVSSVDVDLWQRGLEDLVDVAAYSVATVRMRPPGEAFAQGMPAAFVTPNLFTVLGITPAVGRGFHAGEGRLGQPGVAVVSTHVWHARFGGRPDLIGRELEIDGRAYSVVGIAPAGLEFPPGVGVWLARETGGSRLRDLQIEFASLRVIGRLRSANAFAQASADIEARGDALARDAGRRAAPVAIALHDAVVGSVGATLGLGWAAVGFLFFIACANAASLLLARTASRVRELSLRASLGASRAALVRHVTVEGAILAAGGAFIGLALAAVAITVFERMEPGGMPRLIGIQLSWRSVFFAGGLALLATLLLSTAPLMGISRRPAQLGAGRTGGIGQEFRHRRGAMLVAVQLTVCVVLLVAASVTGWGMLRLLLHDPGFDPDALVVVSIRPDAAYAGTPSHGAVYAPLIERLGAVPGVTAVAMADHLPPDAGGMMTTVAIEGELLDSAEPGQPVRTLGVTGTYFNVLRIPMLAGRAFTDQEIASAAAVVIVDTSVAARAGGRDAVGRRLVMHGAVHEIVGVAGVAQQGALGQPVDPVVYRPLPSGAYGTGGMTFLTEMYAVVRTGIAPPAVVPSVRAALTAPPRVADAAALTTLEDRLWVSLARPRFHAALFGLFAVLGAALAAMGVYGLVSFVVQASATELGVRLALGASRDRIIALVLRRGLGHAALGLAAGLAVAPAVAGLVASRLEGAADAGPGLYAAVAAMLFAVVAAACAAPAWRASRVDPVRTLRGDG